MEQPPIDQRFHCVLDLTPTSDHRRLAFMFTLNKQKCIFRQVKAMAETNYSAEAKFFDVVKMHEKVAVGTQSMR